MATLELTDEQVERLALSLTAEKQEALLRMLVANRWGRWTDLSLLGQERIRQIARERDLDWSSMSEELRENFLDDLLHEG